MNRFAASVSPIGLGRVLLALAAACAAKPAVPAELVVRVVGIADPGGQIGCSLFASKAGFPLDASAARSVWLPADGAAATCRFDDVAEGTYAVAVAHDLNGNRKVDTNFLGIPSEPWGVSNNVRPSLRAPRFDEASFRIEAGHGTTIEVRVAR